MRANNSKTYIMIFIDTIVKISKPEHMIELISDIKVTISFTAQRAR